MYWRWDDDLIVQRTSQDCGDTISPLSDHRTLPGFHVLTYAQILCILQWEASLCLQCWYCWLVGGKRLLTCKIHECMLVVIWLEFDSNSGLHLYDLLLLQNPEWFDILVLAYPGCRGILIVKWELLQIIWQLCKSRTSVLWMLCAFQLIIHWARVLKDVVTEALFWLVMTSPMSEVRPEVVTYYRFNV